MNQLWAFADTHFRKESALLKPFDVDALKKKFSAVLKDSDFDDLVSLSR